MKQTLIILSLLLSLSIQTSAQTVIEVTTNPLVLLFAGDEVVVPVSAELILNDDWGVGIDAALGSFNLVYASGRHYFNPKRGADKFYIGSFIGGGGNDDTSGFGLGFFLGTKWLSKKNVSIDLALGLGRDFTGNMEILPYGKINVGYRFGTSKE